MQTQLKSFRSRIAGRPVLKSEPVHPWVSLVEEFQEQEGLSARDALIAANAHSPHLHIHFLSGRGYIRDPETGTRRAFTPKDQAEFIRLQLGDGMKFWPPLQPDQIKFLEDAAAALESPAPATNDTLTIPSTDSAPNHSQQMLDRRWVHDVATGKTTAKKVDSTIIRMCSGLPEGEFTAAQLLNKLSSIKKPLQRQYAATVKKALNSAPAHQ